MKIIEKSITLQELRQMAQAMFGDMVKAVVDIDREIMAVDSELHSDLEAYLIEQGSGQGDLWGINIYPEATGEDFIEFDSMINVRPTHNNRTRGVDDPKLRDRISAIVNGLVER